MIALLSTREKRPSPLLGSEIVTSKNHQSPGPFTRTVNVTVFMSGTFDLFNNKCKEHHRTALSPILNENEK